MFLAAGLLGLATLLGLFLTHPRDVSVELGVFHSLPVYSRPITIDKAVIRCYHAT